MPLNVRKARIEEAQAIIDLHQDTVRRIHSKDYSPEQIKAWLGRRRLDLTEAMIRDGQYYVGVDEHETLLGFGNIKGNRLFALYVSADHQDRGPLPRTPTLSFPALRRAAKRGLGG